MIFLIHHSSADQNNDVSNVNNNKNQITLPNNDETNENTDQLPTYQSIFANSLTRQHQQEPTTATVSPITRLENGHNNSIQNGNIQQNNSLNNISSSHYTPQ